MYNPHFTPNNRTPFRVGNQVVQARSQWIEVVNYLSGCRDIKKHICVGCTISKLYDKNGKEYIINRNVITLLKVKEMVDAIRKTNAIA